MKNRDTSTVKEVLVIALFLALIMGGAEVLSEMLARIIESWLPF